MLVNPAKANRQGVNYEWEFNEWMHGERGHPMGYAQQAWLAAVYLYADNAVHSSKLPLFDQLLAAIPASAVASEVNDFVVHGGGGPA